MADTRCELCDGESDDFLVQDGIAVCPDCQDDAELAADQMLERQEMEDFEQVDEHFGCYDGGDY